jgi:broad specificity polyphosphatase/5'/3'-nucleotidase SurE
VYCPFGFEAGYIAASAKLAAHEGSCEPDTDLAAVRDGAISITPLELDHTHNESLDHLSRWTKLLESVVRK